MKYTPTELSNLLKQSPENIRLWSIEFASYLSDSAAPKEKGKRRTYNDDDVSVLALVADYKDRGLLFDEIHKALTGGERLMPKTNPLALANYQEQTLALTKEIDELKSDLEQERALRHKAEGQVELLERQLEKLQERLFKREW